jgi:muramidase (phage lysozyme)
VGAIADNLFSSAVPGAPAPGFSAPAGAFGGQYAIPAQGERLLNTIMGPESAGKYNVMYGGKTFSDYRDHPRQAFRIASGPNAGKTSTAAGGFQFLASTWDQQARKLGLKDFSPQNQRIAAWDLAKTTYGRNTGRDLERDLTDPAQLGRIATALHGTWTSLPGGIEQAGGGFDRFSRAFQNAAANPGQQPLGAADYGISTPQVSPSAPTLSAPDPMALAAQQVASSIRQPAAQSPLVQRTKSASPADVFSRNLILSGG